MGTTPRAHRPAAEVVDSASASWFTDHVVGGGRWDAALLAGTGPADG